MQPCIQGASKSKIPVNELPDMQLLSILRGGGGLSAGEGADNSFLALPDREDEHSGRGEDTPDEGKDNPEGEVRLGE